MNSRTYDAYISDIKKTFGNCTFDNIRPLTENKLNDFYAQEKIRKKRLKKVKYALKLVDDSMIYLDSKNLFFPQGSIVLVAPATAEPLVSGKYVVATVKGKDGFVFRRLEIKGDKKILVASNPEYAEITKDFNIFGIVVDVQYKL